MPRRAAQYVDRNQCERICHLLPAGKDGDPDDDSVACRLKYAQKTHYANGTELTGYCHEAGPAETAAAARRATPSAC